MIIVVVLVVVIIVVDAEVDARTAFQRSKESWCHVGTDPVGHSVQFVARHEPTIVVIVVAAVNVVHFGWFLITLFLQKKRERNADYEKKSLRPFSSFSLLTFQYQFINSISVSYVFPTPTLKFSVHLWLRIIFTHKNRFEFWI